MEQERDPVTQPTGDDQAPSRGGLFALFVDRPVLTLMVLVVTLVVGAISLSRLPLRFLPGGLTQNQINVWIGVPRSQAPQQVRDNVIEPLEELMRTIPGLQEINSTARSGNARVRIRLDEGIDPVLAAAEIRDRLQRAMLQWPDGVDRYFTWREDGSAAPLAFLQMLTPGRDSTWDYLMDEVVRTRLEAVDGVGKFDVWGLRDESIRIWFDRDKLIAQRVDFGALLRRLRGDNFTEPVGELDTGRQRFLVRVDSKFRSTSEIEELPIRPGLLLSDVATIERVPEVRDQLSRYNQQYTYTGIVRAASDANPVDTSARMRVAFEELRQDPRLAGLNVRYRFDQGEIIKDGLANLLSTALQGGALALIVLWLFVRSLTMTVSIAMSIPITLLVVSSYLYFTGGSLNICTMAGMTLAVGMVVDNSVVVLENIRRMRERGMSLREACLQGPREVALAVSMATLTTIVVFILPLVFMDDRSAQVTMGALSIPLSLALVASLVVALLLLPSGVRASTADRPPRIHTPYRWSPIQLVLGFNRLLLRFGIHHRAVAVLGGVLILATVYFAGSSLDLQSGDMSPFRRGDVAIQMQLPRGLDIEDAEKLFLEYEKFVLDHKEEWRVDGIGGRFGRNSARVDIYLHPDVTAEETQAAKSRILAAWPRKPGVEIRMSERGGGMQGGGGEETEEARNFVVRLWGRDSEYLMGRAEALRERLERLPETETVDVPAMERSQEVVVQVDRDRIQELGIQPEAILGTVASGLQGRELTRFEEDGREIRLIAQYDASVKPSMLDLRDTRIWTTGRAFQRLDDLGTIEFRNSIADIDSKDGRTNVVLVGRRAEGVKVREMSEALRGAMRTFPLERGYTWTEDSPHNEALEDILNLLLYLGLSLLMVFLVMGVLFESVVLPAAVLVTIPFAAFGAMWSLALFHGGIDPMTVIGMFVLFGIVVNNGIVLLDYIERLRREGLSRDEAILEGVRGRMRPIFMTAATTLFGLLPMAMFGDATDGISYVGMSIAVGGGLAFSTVFTAVSVPLAYSIMDDLSNWLRGVWKTATRGLPAALPDPSTVE